MIEIINETQRAHLQISNIYLDKEIISAKLLEGWKC